eukprot:tig00020538_g10353.t1
MQRFKRALPAHSDKGSSYTDASAGWSSERRSWAITVGRALEPDPSAGKGSYASSGSPASAYASFNQSDLELVGGASQRPGDSHEDALDVALEDLDEEESGDVLRDEDEDEDDSETMPENAPGFIEQLEGDVIVEIAGLGRRFKRISARILIDADIHQIWDVLTDYESLPKFIPNLARCERLEHPTGGIRLLQVGTQSLVYIQFEAKAVMDVVERPYQEIEFSMVDGDFHVFRGLWRLTPAPDGSRRTILRYSVDVKPKVTLPLTFISAIIRNDLPTNLLAVKKRAEKLALLAPAAPPSSEVPLTPDQSPLPSFDDEAANFLGPASYAIQDPSACPLEPTAFEATPLVESVRKRGKWYQRISAGFVVNADRQTVWNVLTDYEALRSFVPNLMQSERLPSEDPAVVRILQVAVKYHMYFQFQARAVIDVVEVPTREIRFTMVEGDFQEFQGKWSIVANKGDPRVTRVAYTVEVRPKGAVPFGVVERIISADLPIMLAALSQRMASMFQEKARRVRQPLRQPSAASSSLFPSRPSSPSRASSASPTPAPSPLEPSARRPRNHFADFENLRGELLAFVEANGTPGVMPKSRTLRDARRVDLLKAITLHGGVGEVARKMGLEIQHKEAKPWGYWDKMANMERELTAFIEEHGAPGYMPTREAMRGAGRVDLARAVDKYGGLVQVAHMLGLKLSRKRRGAADGDGAGDGAGRAGPGGDGQEEEEEE